MGKNAAIMQLLMPIAIALGLYFLVLRPILQKVGIVKDEEDLKVDKINEQGIGKGSPWDPRFYETVPKAKLIKMDFANKLAKDLWDAGGLFNDNEEKIYGVLRQLNYKTQLSFLSKVFLKNYEKDLFSWLSDRLSDSELMRVNDIVKTYEVGNS